MIRAIIKCAVPAFWIVSGITAVRAQTCPNIPQIPSALGIEEVYVQGDESHSIIDPAKVKIQNELRKRIDQPVMMLVQLADNYSNSKNAAQRKKLRECVINSLVRMAEYGAFLKSSSPFDNQYRNWMISALALSYIKIEPLKKSDPRINKIDSWLIANVNYLSKYFSQRRRRNNHIYWNGLAITAVGIATNKCAIIDNGRNILREGLAAVKTNGTLPEELRRGKDALHYHIFAAKALTAMGILHGNLTQTEIVAMRRLIEAILQGMDGNGPIIANSQLNQKSEDNYAFVRLYLPFANQNIRNRSEKILATRKNNNFQFFLGGDLSIFKNKINPCK